MLVFEPYINTCVICQGQRGSRSLIQNLASVSGVMQIQVDHYPGDKPIPVVSSEDRHMEGLGHSGGESSETQEADVEVPEIMEEVIEQLLAGLRDKVWKQLPAPFALSYDKLKLLVIIPTTRVRRKLSVRQNLVAILEKLGRGLLTVYSM